MLPNPAVSGYVHKEDPSNSVAFRLGKLMPGLVSLLRPKPVDPSLRGFHDVALLRDLQDSPDAQEEEIARRFLGHKAFAVTKYMKRIRQRSTAQKADD